MEMQTNSTESTKCFSLGSIYALFYGENYGCSKSKYRFVLEGLDPLLKDQFIKPNDKLVNITEFLLELLPNEISRLYPGWKNAQNNSKFVNGRAGKNKTFGKDLRDYFFKDPTKFPALIDYIKEKYSNKLRTDHTEIIIAKYKDVFKTEYSSATCTVPLSEASIERIFSYIGNDIYVAISVMIIHAIIFQENTDLWEIIIPGLSKDRYAQEKEKTKKELQNPVWLSEKSTNYKQTTYNEGPASDNPTEEASPFSSNHYEKANMHNQGSSLLHNKKSYIFAIGAISFILLALSYAVAALGSYHAALTCILYSGVGFMLSSIYIFSFKSTTKKKIQIFYLFSILSMLLLSSPLGVEKNGVTWWIGVKDTVLFRPDQMLLLSSLLILSIMQGKISRKSSFKKVLTHNLPLVLSLILLGYHNTYWIPLVILLIASFYFSLQTKNIKNIIINIIIIMTYIMYFINRSKWHISTWFMLFNYRLEQQLQKASLIGPTVTEYDPLWLESDSFLTILFNWGWIGIFLVVLLFFLLSCLAFQARNGAKKNRDTCGYQITSACGLYFLLTTIFSLFDSMTGPASSSFILLDFIGLESILYFLSILFVIKTSTKQIAYKSAPPA